MRHHSHTSHSHSHHHHEHSHDHAHDHDHAHPPHGPGHNHPNAQRAPVQWQTPHQPDGAASPAAPEPDLDKVEAAFVDGFIAAPDPTSFLRLARIPFEFTAGESSLKLLRVEIDALTDVGSLTPHLGGSTFRYDPLPTNFISRRRRLRFGDKVFIGRIAQPLRPDMEPAAGQLADFPDAPDAFAFAEPAIEDIMGADIAFDPMALASGYFVAALDQKSPDIVIAFAGHGTISKRQMHIHAVPVARSVIVKPDPRT